MIDHIGAVYTRMKLSCQDRLDRVWYVTKIGQDNDMAYCNGGVYAENEIDLSSSIRPTIIYDENQIENDVTDCTNVVYAKTKLSYHL